MTKLIKQVFLGAVIIALSGAVIFSVVQSSSDLDKSSSSGGLTANKIGGDTDTERTFNSFDKYTFLGDLDIKGKAIIGNSVISSNEITVDSINAKNIYVNGNEIGGLEMCRPDGFDYNTICSVPVKEGDVLCPIWMDCDGDGYTYGAGDCDENCADCYVESEEYTTDPDGRDQNCDGVIDEASDEEICIQKGDPQHESCHYWCEKAGAYECVSCYVFCGGCNENCITETCDCGVNCNDCKCRIKYYQ